MTPLGTLVQPVSKAGPDPDSPAFIYIDLSSVNSELKQVVAPSNVAVADAPSRARQRVRAGDILVSTVRPNLNGVAVVPEHLGDAIASTGFSVLRAKAELLDSRYLFQFVRSPNFVSQLVRRATGASYPAVSEGIVREVEIPLPPLPEQRRIAATLDRADEPRAKRRHALELIHAIETALFESSFLGGQWSTVLLSDLLAEPLRNGISPSASGKHMGKVLTLSAITRGSFDASAVKESTFAALHDVRQTVRAGDFLICRGNGNKSMVGVGVLATETMPAVAFPDTIIAARLAECVVGAYLEAVWQRTEIRRQIESGARTTNGTYKVNQEVVNGIQVPLPPLDLQERFASAVTALSTVREKHHRHLVKLDEMFRALQAQLFGREP
ncbi:MAG: restriction endonuclease subunit S [Pseudolysinimonas sp.]